jgi:uncharacterized protein YjbI with pentapeptide repeats
MEGARLVEAHLEEAHFGGANLARADLHDAHVEGAKMRWARGLTQAQIDAAIGDEETELPEDLARPEHWCAKAATTAG